MREEGLEAGVIEQSMLYTRGDTAHSQGDVVLVWLEQAVVEAPVPRLLFEHHAAEREQLL